MEKSYKELQEEKLRLEDEMRVLQKEADAKACEKRIRDWKRREQAKLDYAAWLPNLEKWVRANLQPETYVKMKGTRDGGVRVFLTLRQSSYGPFFECRQVRRERIYLSEERKWGGYENVLGQITQHMFDKLTHVMIDEKWVRVKDLPGIE